MIILFGFQTIIYCKVQQFDVQVMNDGNDNSDHDPDDYDHDHHNQL